MTRARRPVVLLVTLALAAAPGAALAQSGAGDEQYQDPFSGQQGGGSKGAGGSLGQAPPSAAPSPSAAPNAQAPAALPAELAHTGADMRLLAAAGLVLLIGGLTLRRRADGR